MRRMNQLFVLLRWVTKLNASKVTVCGILFIAIIASSVELGICVKSSRTVNSFSENVSLKKVPLSWTGTSDKSMTNATTSSTFKKPITGKQQLSMDCGKSNSKHSSKCKKQKKMDVEKLPYPKEPILSKDKLPEGDKIKKGLAEMSKSLLTVQKLTPSTIKKINKFINKKQHYCKLENFKGLTCQKLKLSSWLVKQLERDHAQLNSWVEIVPRSENETKTEERSLKNEMQADTWPEKIAYKLIKSWGGPEDLLVFYKYKEFLKSRELKVSLPYKAQLKISSRNMKDMEESKGRSSTSSPSSSSSSLLSRTYSVALGGSSPRFFWDPGFNLKLKLPFFRDELKVAVSTGPSFVAGIGVGIVILMVKSMFAPMLLGMKWMMYNFFFKESGPFDLMKMFFLSHAPESAPWESAPIPPPAIEHYQPPPIRDPFNHHRPFGRPRPPPPPPRHHHPHHHHPHHHHSPHHHHHPPYHRAPKGFRPPPPPPPHFHGPGHFDFHDAPFDLKHQFTHPTPVIQSLNGENPTMSQLEHLYRAQLDQDGMKDPPFTSLISPDPTNPLDHDGGINSLGDGVTQHESHDSPSYIPSTGLQAEVEHFDPFYSPLLSKIDSIFTHLGHEDEGCRERVVCSIYKFPVKYAPYSNLLSAQLSKHQSELKRPVTSSPKILRYFRYMKAAKDGQGGDNCIDLYPKCSSDTDTVSSLPMITTFHQLSELMTAESSSPGVALATADQQITT